MLSNSVVSDSLLPHGLYPTRILCPWGFSSKNTGLGCYALLQGILATQGLYPGLPHFREILYYLSHQGSPRILEWVAYPFSRDLPNPGIKPGSPELQAYSLPAALPRKPVHNHTHPNIIWPMLKQLASFTLLCKGMHIHISIMFIVCRIFSEASAYFTLNTGKGWHGHPHL